jgi:hypothetical protein
MRLPVYVVVAILLACARISRAADATTPVDPAQRNTPFAPATSSAVTPAKKKPDTNAAVQEKRVDKSVVDKKTAPLSERRAAIEMTEAREKQVREKESHRPEGVEKQRSAFDHRLSAVSTGENTTKPPTVAKYQDSLTSATATNMARYPAMDRATAVKINRFVFRKNPAEAAAVTDGAKVTPAAGGPLVPK